VWLNWRWLLRCFSLIILIIFIIILSFFFVIIKAWRILWVKIRL
jgi:hypothetical protein